MLCIFIIFRYYYKLNYVNVFSIITVIRIAENIMTLNNSIVPWRVYFYFLNVCFLFTFYCTVTENHCIRIQNTNLLYIHPTVIGMLRIIVCMEEKSMSMQGL